MMFQESLRSKESVKLYTWTIDQFIKYHNLQKKNYDGIVGMDGGKIGRVQKIL